MREGKVALVTGAGTGIGKAAALAMLQDGYRVALVGRRKELLEKTASGFDNAMVLPGDITKQEVVKAVFAKVKERWGRLDVLFNNAGMGAPAIPMEDLSFEQWKAVVDVNLTGSFLCAQEAIRMFKEQKPLLPGELPLEFRKEVAYVNLREPLEVLWSRIDERQRKAVATARRRGGVIRRP